MNVCCDLNDQTLTDDFVYTFQHKVHKIMADHNALCLILMLCGFRTQTPENIAAHPIPSLHPWIKNLKVITTCRLWRHHILIVSKSTSTSVLCRFCTRDFFVDKKWFGWYWLAVSNVPYLARWWKRWSHVWEQTISHITTFTTRWSLHTSLTQERRQQCFAGEHLRWRWRHATSFIALDCNY